MKTDSQLKCYECGADIKPGLYAISRKDNKTKICPPCGTNEAILGVYESFVKRKGGKVSKD